MIVCQHLKFVIDSLMLFEQSVTIRVMDEAQVKASRKEN